MTFGIAHIAQRDSDKPCMQLHATLVTFLNGKGQGVITGSYAMLSCKDWGKGFYLRGIDDIATYACL